jgi:hypothetical protein
MQAGYETYQRARRTSSRSHKGSAFMANAPKCCIKYHRISAGPRALAVAAQRAREKLLVLLMPRESAGVRSHRLLRSRWPSTLVGPPFLAVLVLCEVWHEQSL